MKKFTIKTILATAICAFVLYSCTKESTTPNSEIQEEDLAHVITYSKGEPIEGSYIVVYKEDAFPSLLGRAAITKENYKEQKTKLENDSKVMMKEKGFVGKTITQSYVKTIKGIALELTDDELQTLRQDDRIDYIEQDQILSVSMGGPPGGGGGGGSDPQVTPWGVTRVGGAINGANSGTAWIIDSGIDLDHPDLNVDVANSATFLGGNTTPDDQNGHGTHVAGTVAAINNEIGVIGVAAGATVVSVRVLNRRGSGSNSGVIAGVDYVGANAASGDAANMSLGGGISTALDNAVIAAASSSGCNCPFALAAGNESQNANNSSPARANGNNIYTVSSMTSNNDNWSSFSNYGNPPVDFCAPGSSILSTYKSGGYATLSGTSMAAPHVCGILLIGGITTDGTVNGDPDGNPDDIAHH